MVSNDSPDEAITCHTAIEAKAGSLHKGSAPSKELQLRGSAAPPDPTSQQSTSSSAEAEPSQSVGDAPPYSYDTQQASFDDSTPCSETEGLSSSGVYGNGTAEMSACQEDDTEAANDAGSLWGVPAAVSGDQSWGDQPWGDKTWGHKPWGADVTGGNHGEIGGSAQEVTFSGYPSATAGFTTAPRPSSVVAAAAAAAALRPRALSSVPERALVPGFGSGSLSLDVVSTSARIVFPGSSALAIVRRGIVELLRSRTRQYTMGLAELGLRLPHHPEAGPVWTDSLQLLPKLREVVEGMAGVAPGVIHLDRNEISSKQLTAALNIKALQMAALRRAVAAAFPGTDDVSMVRRAAATALLEAQPPVPSVYFSLNMPALGVAVIQTASAPRQRLAQVRGASFSLAAVLIDRLNPANGADVGEAASTSSYFVLSMVGPSRIARLDTERLLADAAAGLLGDLTSVQPVQLMTAVSGPAVFTRGLSPSAGFTTATAAAAAPSMEISPRVKEVLRAAIPEGRSELHAKRCLALMAAGSLGAKPAATAPYDPPFTLRSGACGVLLHDLDLRPPKGQMRTLIDEEPHVFRAGKPSPSYLIELVYGPLLELATTHPEEVGAAVAALLKGRMYAGLRFRTPSTVEAVEAVATSTLSNTSATIAEPPVASAAASSRPPAAVSTASGSEAVTLAATYRKDAVDTSAFVAGSSGTDRHFSFSSDPPRGQPPNYYVRLERALEQLIEGNAVGEFITRAWRVMAMALLKRTRWSGGPGGRPPHAISIRDAAILLKQRLPEAYSSRRPPGVFPINALILAQQQPLLFAVDKPNNDPKGWSIRLNINSLELSAQLNPTLPPGRDTVAPEVEAPAEGGAEGEEVSEDPGVAYDDVYDTGTAPPKAQVTEPSWQMPPAVAAAEVADLLAMQPARALATALAPTIPPDLLQKPIVRIITVPYSAEHVTALAHCMSCPQIGLAAKSVDGWPTLVLLYAPAVDSLKPATAAGVAASVAAVVPPPPAGFLPATVYIVDASATVAAGPGCGSDSGSILLASLRVLLEEPGVAKVVHGCEQLLPSLEHSVGCVICPLLDTRLVSEMLRPLDLSSLRQQNESDDDQEARVGPELWAPPSNWQAALTVKYWDYNVAAVQHADGSDSSWLHRPLSDNQVGMLMRSVQHLPELWSALTWLLPRLAQFCSIARAQQCRAMLSPVEAAAQGAW